ncbi:MAG: tripartite tricarboxylate transporter substrate binding protein [Hydrogenophaga sp.]|jgi:tripartite-type tricarboxylate transporter receptor subunit TctC|nr:tripartite tricarboxylate transporter substrate binding protein [Hydrogenophaga sp.]
MTNLTTRRAAMGLMACMAALSGLPAAHAQAFPSKTLTLVVPFPAGGGPDVAARVFAEMLAPRLGQAVVVENRPGAGALLGAGVVAKSAADGHTLLFTPNTVVISPHVLPPGAGGGVDVQRDLVPVIAPATTPMVLVANPQLGATNLKAALEMIRKTPGMPYGSPGNGSPMHFAGEMFQRSAKVNLLHVPYRGVAPSITAALGGEVKLLFTGLGGAVQHIKAGKLVPLAVTESARSSLMPDVPTATEQGVPGVEVAAWYGVFAPKDTPAATVTRLNQEFNAVLQMPEVRTRLTAAGLELLGGTPQQLDALVKADHQRYGSLARELNIKAD